MKVGLFIPCFMDQFYPNAAMSCLELLEKLGVDVEYPQNQTCCGQPMANSGCQKDAKGAAEHFLEVFSKYDAVVAPSGSCVSMVKNHYHEVMDENEKLTQMSSKIYELSEFLVDVLKVNQLEATCHAKVGLHKACHGLRELRLGESSELANSSCDSKPAQLLKLVQGIELVSLQREDECCGFGGTFAVAQDSVSCHMGKMKLEDFEQAQAEIVVSTDMSCLMHLSGLASRNNKSTKFVHLAEVLNGDCSK
jgi:L-lactate dehydrogenase complex protein LldE